MTDRAGSPPRGGGGRLAAFVLAVVFLTIIGAVGGYLVGRHANALNAAQRQAGGGSDAGTDTPTHQAPVSSGKPCPDISEKDAKKAGSPGGLTQVRYLETARSEAWVCRAGDGEFWYQGHDKSGGFDDAHTILLRGVEAQDGGVYVAVNNDENGTTRYLVYSDRLVIEVKGQKRDPENAIRSEAG